MTKNRKLTKSIRKLNLKPRRAVLADGGYGTPHEPGRPGYVRVRYPASPENTDGFTYPTVIRLNAIVNMNVGQAVLVGYDADNEIAVIGTDFSGTLAAGGNPWANNPSDDRIVGYVDQRDITTLRCQPLGSSAPMSVSVFPWARIENGVYSLFAGEVVDLTSSIPAVAGEHGLAFVLLKTDNTLEVTVSTPKDESDPFVEADVTECLAAATSGSYPVKAWKLYAGMTAITDADEYFDARQFINAASSGTTDDSGLYLALGVL